MKGYHTRWTVPDEHRASPEYVEAGARIALGQAVYDRRVALGLSQAELAARAGTTQTVISRLEGGAVTPTLPLLHRWPEHWRASWTSRSPAPAPARSSRSLRDPLACDNVAAGQRPTQPTRSAAAMGGWSGGGPPRRIAHSGGPPAGRCATRTIR
ncbi:helix-turn-helix domain-containing protein [Solwaraspora sp. WMMD937]|nr:helix-turn-helix domain-containing protein [Solwaraspora sp. WMMD937]WFE23938.1 helix-turn-helix domain-containing protein [Solwaraspora sp. WMMD937]